MLIIYVYIYIWANTDNVNGRRIKVSYCATNVDKYMIIAKFENQGSRKEPTKFSKSETAVLNL